MRPNLSGAQEAIDARPRMVDPSIRFHPATFRRLKVGLWDSPPRVRQRKNCQTLRAISVKEAVQKLRPSSFTAAGQGPERVWAFQRLDEMPVQRPNLGPFGLPSVQTLDATGPIFPRIGRTCPPRVQELDGPRVIWPHPPVRTGFRTGSVRFRPRSRSPWE